MTRVVLFTLLAIVAGAAAVLSFAALDELGVLCGFGPLSPLLPVVVDAGAAAGTVAWLARTGRPREFGRVLALVLLAGSVAGNAASHALTAYATVAPWWAVVVVSAVPPAVLGAVVHLATLAVQTRTEVAELHGDGLDDEGGYDQVVDEHGVSRLWATAPPVEDFLRHHVPAAGGDHGVGQPPSALHHDRATELIAAGVGRRRLARELEITEHQARELLDARRNGGAA